MHIRLATINDAAAISKLGSITFTETFGHYFRDPNDLQEYLSFTFSKEKILSSIRKENNLYWLATVHNQPAGYAKLKKRSPSEHVASLNSSQLQKIYICKEHHGKGMGNAMLEQIIAAAKDTKSDTLWLSVLKANAPALSFYERTGFTATGEHCFTIGKEIFDFSVLQCRV